MTEIQLKLLDMLKWFHEFCIENKLRYYALGGTMLGAIRHKGFIPWDDDIDVGMPREDYDKMIELVIDKQDEKYRLEKPLQNKDFVYQYCKLYDTSTTLVENTRYKTKRGVYLDIFPLDGIGNTQEESKKNFKKIDKKTAYIMTKVCGLSKNRKLYKNLAIIVSRYIIFPRWQKVLKNLDILCRTRKFDDCDYVANLYGNWHEREIVKREWFGTPCLYEFEDFEIYGVQNYDSYLSAIYGNYMKLPPIEKQKSHHDYLSLDLEKSYLHV
ncbi:LicD family protein [Pumilibacter intestinalis]|uniref:LicD family protein n=1 Tax=Pumilibacter intestinalis TaxID=2941511 RepID=UPI00203E5D4B|nr:LicD family protein [Pumilibacter intestinalis]